jgi:hypothetical protein
MKNKETTSLWESVSDIVSSVVFLPGSIWCFTLHLKQPFYSTFSERRLKKIGNLIERCCKGPKDARGRTNSEANKYNHMDMVGKENLLSIVRTLRNSKAPGKGCFEDPTKGNRVLINTRT